MLTTSEQVTCNRYCEAEVSDEARSRFLKQLKVNGLFKHKDGKKKAPWQSFASDKAKYGDAKTYESDIPANNPPRTKPLISFVREDGTIELAPTSSEKIANFSNLNPVSMQNQVVEAEKIAENEQQFLENETPELLENKSSGEVTQNENGDTKSSHKDASLTRYGNPKRRRGNDVAFSTKTKILTRAGVEEGKVPSIGTPEREAMDKKWRFYVDQGQKIVSKMGHDRLKVAELALAACELAHGGGNHWKGFEGVFTLAKYAKEVGISYKTLNNWTRIKRNVYDKLTAMGANIDPSTDWSKMNAVSGRCDADKTPEQVLKLYNKWDVKKDFNHERYLLQALRRFRTFSYYLETQNPAHKLFDEEDLKELKHHVKVVGKWLKE